MPFYIERYFNNLKNSNFSNGSKSIVCIFLSLGVVKLVKITNRYILAKISMKTKVKDILSEIRLEIKSSDKNKKQ